MNIQGLNGTSTIKIAEECNAYSYDKVNNIMKINMETVLKYGLDLQHMVLNWMLEMVGPINPEYESFKRGITEVISSTINYDDSRKKINAKEFLLASAFTKIVDVDVILGAYMNGSMVDIIMFLDSIGVSKEEFDSLTSSFSMLNDSRENNTSFCDAEIKMIDMFGKKVTHGIQKGVYNSDDISPLYDSFSDMLVYSRGELTAICPNYDFSNLTGFERIKPTLDNAIVNIEAIEVEKRVK